jgi:hypothetical protein
MPTYVYPAFSCIIFPLPRVFEKLASLPVISLSLSFHLGYSFPSELGKFSVRVRVVYSVGIRVVIIITTLL